MRYILNKLQESKDRLDEKREAREGYYDARSEKWQESDLAVEYQETTDELGYRIDELEEVMAGLEELDI